MNVAIVEDDPRYRESLEMLLTHAPGVALAGSFSAASDAVRHLELLEAEGREGEWNLVLMDINLPGMNGIDAIRRLKAIAPNILVVMLTVFEEPGTILEAICAGADGYLLKRTGSTELLAQLRVVAGGGAPLTSGVARSVLDLLRRSTPGEVPGHGHAAPALHLTERERDVLRGLVRGLAYKQVAVDLGVSLDTVRHHIRGIYSKLQVHSVAEAVSRAIRERLT